MLRIILAQLVFILLLYALIGFIFYQDVNDDEKEKEERKSRKEEEKNERLSRAAAEERNNGLGILNNFSQAELDEHYSKCIDLVNKNVSLFFV